MIMATFGMICFALGWLLQNVAMATRSWAIVFVALACLVAGMLALWHG